MHLRFKMGPTSNTYESRFLLWKFGFIKLKTPSSQNCNWQKQVGKKSLYLVKYNFHLNFIFLEWVRSSPGGCHACEWKLVALVMHRCQACHCKATGGSWVKSLCEEVNISFIVGASKASQSTFTLQGPRVLPRGCQPSLLEILSFQIRVESNLGELLVARVLSVIDERGKGTWLESHI